MAGKRPGLATRRRTLGFTQDLPRTDRYLARSLLLPMKHLLSDEQVGSVIAAIREFFG